MKPLTYIYLLLLFIPQVVWAQNTGSLADSLNRYRILINKTGMETLMGEGAASIGVGTIGYFTAADKTTKSFYEMAAIWGVVNAGIAVAGFIGVKNEVAQILSCRQAFEKYEKTTKLYLINSGLDVIYISGGAYLINRSNHAQNNPQVLNGFGKAIALQGILLLVFDQVMYHSHRSNNAKWRQVLNGTCITNNGIGFRYSF